jgi:hypothetical protein
VIATRFSGAPPQFFPEEAFVGLTPEPVQFVHASLSPRRFVGPKLSACTQGKTGYVDMFQKVLEWATHVIPGDQHEGEYDFHLQGSIGVGERGEIIMSEYVYAKKTVLVGAHQEV